MSQTIMAPQKSCSDENLEITKIQDNEPVKTESTIVIIPGVNDVYDNATPPNSTVDMNGGNPCPSLVDVGNKTYTKMRVPNWYVEGYKTIGVGKAICFMNHWVTRSNSKGGEIGGTTRDAVDQTQGFTCVQGRIPRNSCHGPPATFPKPLSVKTNFSCGTNSKFQEIVVCRSLPYSCEQTSKGLSTVQASREILVKPQHCACVPKTGMLVGGQVNELLPTGAENSPDIKRDNNEKSPEDNNAHVARKPLKTKKDFQTKRSSKSTVNSKESKFPSVGKNHKIFEDSKTSKQNKTKGSKTKESPTNSNSMVTQSSQTSFDVDPNDLHRQQYPNQSFVAEITAYLGKASIKKRCDPSVVEHLLSNLFGSQFPDIDGIQIRKIRTGDSSCIMHKDQSTVTVDSCYCQTELQNYQNDVDDLCNESKEVNRKMNAQYSATNIVQQDSNPIDESDDCHAQVYCSRSFVMQRPQQCLYTSDPFRIPLKCKIYSLHEKCVNCGRTKANQKQESNITLRSFIQNIPESHTISGRYTT